MVTVDELKFDAAGLIPAIVVDAQTNAVLMLAYMNRESLEISLERGLTCFFSRSRQELWLKGETSGNYQHIVSITADCDADTLLVRVSKDGPACHTGTESCFFNALDAPAAIAPTVSCEQDTGADTATQADTCADVPEEFSLQTLYRLLEDRRAHMPEGSYTSYLFEKGIDKILKKVGEESTEVIIAAKADDKRETIYELADLAYHALVLMVQMGISVDEVREELAGRHIIDHKVKQEKMC